MTPFPNGARLFLDLRALQDQANAERGIGRYSSEFVRALLAADAPIDGLAFDPAFRRPPSLHESILTAPSLCWNTAGAFASAAAKGPVIYHALSVYENDAGPEALYPRHAFDAAALRAVTVFDMIPYEHPEVYLADPVTAARYEARLRMLKRFDLFLCISEHSRDQLVEIAGVDPRATEVIGAGVSPFFSPASVGGDPAGEVTVPGITRPFVLTVLGDEWRKNTGRMIEAWAALPPPVRRSRQLVAVCNLSDGSRDSYLKRAKGLRLEADEIVFTGRVDDEELRSLYRNADLFVFPSLSEGFGLPPAEAARCGAPVITSNTTSLPEVLELEEATFDPRDSSDISATMLRALTDADYRSRLLAASEVVRERHTWENVARRAMQAFGTADVGDRYASKTERRKRVALVGPYAPAASGVAAYNSRVAAVLAEHCDLDCFFDQGSAGPDPDRVPGARMFPVGALGEGAAPNSYDAIVYSLGNSGFHVETIQAAHRWPGVVWLHDVNLAGLVWSRVMQEAGEDPNRAAVKMRKRIDRYYPGEVPLSLYGESLLDPAEHPRHNIFWARSATRRARHAIVHSSVAARLLRFDQGLVPTCDVSVIPLAIPEPSQLRVGAGDVAHGTPGRTLVASFGQVHSIKQPFLLLDAVAALDEVDVAFVGVIDEPGLDVRIVDYAQQLGFAGAVTVTGSLSAGEYGEWLACADVAVQLRAATYGESSAAVTDAIAAGLPVITNIASAAEMPRGVVTWVPHDVSAEDLAAAIVASSADSVPTAAQAAYAAENSFAATARRLLDVVDQLSPIGSPG